MSGLIPDPSRLFNWFINHLDVEFIRLLDLGLVLLLTYLLLLVIGERRTLWMVQGFILLMFAAVVSEWFKLELLAFVLDKLVLGSAVALAVIFQGEFRRFLELLGRLEIGPLFQRRKPNPRSDNVIDELVDAVKELSQNRTGALIVLEIFTTLNRRIFVNPGVDLNAEVSKELLQTIFQMKTLLHDGAVFIRGSRIISAGVILPLSERTASRQLGTRHRAAMGMTERVDNCLCIVVSEETGSISLAEGGNLNRPLTSSKLKGLLEERFSPPIDREDITPNLGGLRRLLKPIFNLFPHRRSSRLPSTSKKDNQ